MNKVIIISLVLLLSTPSVRVLDSGGIETSNIIYVGGSGYGNYSSIQQAIDNASSGDTIFIYTYSSPYYENIVIDKPLTLIGEDQDTTIIDGRMNGDVILIESSNVVISNLTIVNCSFEYSNIHLVYSNNNSITNCRISSNDNGIRMYNSNNNVISSCIISSCYSYSRKNYYGISLSNSNNNIITDNYIRFNSIGVSISQSNNNYIHNCEIYSNKLSGISIAYSDNNRIYNSHILNNAESGIDVIFSTRNCISNCIVERNGNSGLSIGLSTHISVSNCTISSNYIGIQAIIIPLGGNNTFINCTISDNVDTGILLDSASGNNIYRCRISKSDIGINLLSETPYDATSNNIISRCDVFDNSYGILLWSSNKNIILENNFKSNKCQAVFYNAFLNHWFRNYWDDWPGIIPRPIKGWFFLTFVRYYPWINFDWHPAREPYDIDGGGI